MEPKLTVKDQLVIKSALEYYYRDMVELAIKYPEDINRAVISDILEVYTKIAP